MNWIQVFDVLWLTSLLALLWLIWRSSERRRKQDKARDTELINTLVSIGQKDADNARQAVQVAQDAIALLKAGKSDVL